MHGKQSKVNEIVKLLNVIKKVHNEDICDEACDLIREYYFKMRLHDFARLFNQNLLKRKLQKDPRDVNKKKLK